MTVFYVGVVIALAVTIIVVVVRTHIRAAAAAGGRIRIIGIPPGEAPEEVRRAWVGLELPLVRAEGQPRPQWGLGVLSWRRAPTLTGYAVDGGAAWTVLASASPDAAAWWREHSPQSVTPGYQLLFPAEVCEKMV
jgi:hypothetical protein